MPIPCSRSIAKYDPLPIDLDDINDINLARRFAELESESARYCPSWKRWLVWDGTRWATDVTLEIEHRLKSMIRGAVEHVGDMAIVRDDDGKEVGGRSAEWKSIKPNLNPAIRASQRES